MTDALHVKLRPLEREDLRFVHQLDNNASVMRYWFEEPYEAFVELSDLYDKHIFTIKASAALSSNAMAIKPDWWSWLKSTMCTAEAEFQIIISPTSREKVSPPAPHVWRWTMALPCSICISCI